ncbi:MAG: hypothetical protein AABZ27_07675 [Candidatus Omnitrophota bacterium]
MNQKVIVIIIVCLFISWVLQVLLHKLINPRVMKNDSVSSLEQKMKSVKPEDIEKIKRMMGQ